MSNNKNKGGRPVKYTPEVVAEIKKNLEKYIEKAKIPIFAEFAYQNKPYIPRQYLYELPALSDTIKKLIEKKQVILEKGTLTGNLNPAMAIFSLKQLGWRDRQEIDHTTQGEKITDINVVVKGRKSKLINLHKKKIKDDS